MQRIWGSKLNDEVLISELIAPIDRYGKTGHIHSVFGHSFNIKVQEQLIHVSSYKNYLSSFGLHIADHQLQKILSKIEVGNFCKLQVEKIIIYAQDGLSEIALKEAKRISLRLPELTIETDELRLLIKRIEDYQLSAEIGLSWNDQGIETIALMQSATALTDTEVKAISKFLIGRGKGLTPSGDDILVAYLATLTALKNEHAKHFIDCLNSFSTISTTEVSRAYLEGVIQGYVSSPILEFFKEIKGSNSIELILKKFEAVLQIGHTSGKDMGFGIYLALCYYKNRIEER